MNPTPLHYQTIAEVADRIAAKELSPVDLTTAMLDRIDQLEGQLTCYATLMADEARPSAEVDETPKSLHAGRRVVQTL